MDVNKAYAAQAKSKARAKRKAAGVTQKLASDRLKAEAGLPQEAPTADRRSLLGRQALR